MEDNAQIHMMLDLMQQPAFSVENGIITHVNNAASRYLLLPGLDVHPMLSTGLEEYAAFTQDYLYLTLEIHGFRLGATVARTDQTHIFLMEESDAAQQLQALALAATVLRQPLSGALAVAGQLHDTADEHSHHAQLSRYLSQIQRIVSNMSDSMGYSRGNTCAMEYVEICNFAEELLAKAALALSKAGFTLEYTLPEHPIYTLANPQRLERAMYNMLSNACKFSPKDSTIHAQLLHREHRLSFSVTNPGAETESVRDLFTRYLREPGIESPLHGLGLGMVIIRSAATAHGGAVLVDHPEVGNTRVTMTMAIRHSKTTDIHSPVFRIDYAGERDHCLLELSDVLPFPLFDQE